jgi:hypothetical protein
MTVKNKTAGNPVEESARAFVERRLKIEDGEEVVFRFKGGNTTVSVVLDILNGPDKEVDFKDWKEHLTRILQDYHEEMGTLTSSAAVRNRIDHLTSEKEMYVSQLKNLELQREKIAQKAVHVESLIYELEGLLGPFKEAKDDAG